MEEKEIYFFEPSEFSWIPKLEMAYTSIKEEFNHFINLQESQDEFAKKWFAAHPHYVASDSGKTTAWKTLELLFFGIKKEINIDLFPKTWDALSQIDGLVTAQFSMMEPQTHIQPHKGYSRMVSRHHLGLLVPYPSLCGIRVGDTTRTWEEGKVLSFDDSYEHEAWNHSDERRAVLMFDIANKAWGYEASQICRYKLSTTKDPFLLDIADNETWLKWYEAGSFPPDFGISLSGKKEH